MLWALVIACLLSKAVSIDITGSGDTAGDFGGDAQYSCTLADASGVLQVTWQRLYKDESVEDLATYSKRFGTQVSRQDKVVFTEASLSSTSITVRNLTWEDEACYICSFNVYPSGSRRKQTCLTVQGVSEVETDVQQIPSSGPEVDVEVVVRCSATGKPAPVIHWSHSDIISLTTVQNDDKTFTSTSNLTLHPSSHLGGKVDCLVNNGTRGQRRVTIDLPSTGDEVKEGEQPPRVTAVIVTGLIVILCIPCLIFCFLKKRKRLQMAVILGDV